jgi:hypothetical protein
LCTNKQLSRYGSPRIESEKLTIGWFGTLGKSFMSQQSSF